MKQIKNFKIFKLFFYIIKVTIISYLFIFQPPSSVYGLKLLKTKENAYVNTYLSEETYKTVQHLDCLKIAFTLEYLISKNILPHLNGLVGTPERAICYEHLTKLALDPEFINVLGNFFPFHYSFNFIHSTGN